MSNDFVLSSETISVFEKNGVVLLKNMINNKWQRILINAIEEDIIKLVILYNADVQLILKIQIRLLVEN